jgi:Mn-dependent DtxR family transcriptional regulator
MNETTKRNQSTEDYLEQILLLSKGCDQVHRIDVAKSLGVSGAAVNKAMKILVEKGYLYEDGKHLRLTAEGERYASEVFERHCIIRAFLKKLGVSERWAEEDACKMEHLVSEETFLAMKKYTEQ